MKLVVKNFGPIKESVIDLSKRYYFFVGYNNTGKTYLSKLIYDIFNGETLNDFTKSSFAKNKIEEGELTIILTEELIESVLKDFAEFLKETVIPKSLKTNIDSNFILKNLDIHFEFDFQKDVVTPTLSSGIAISVETDDMETDNVEIYSLRKDANSLEIKCEYFTNEDISKKLPNDFFENIPKKIFERRINTIRRNITKDISESLLKLLLQNKEKPFFLPANRIFILENADELVEQARRQDEQQVQRLIELLESSEDNKEKVGNLMARRVSGKHTKQINYLVNEISELRKNKDEDFIKNGTGFFDDTILDLSQLMGGEIIMSKSSGISNWEEKFKISDKKDENKSLGMYLASSSINQLGTLFLYLKYWAKSNDNFLMIDEPEENLHPKSQIKLLDLLLKFGNKGNKVLITTHSPLVAEIINNYLVLSQLENKSELSEKLNLVNTDLSLDKAGIYYFNGETVTEHKTDKYGTIFTSFKEAQDNIYEIGDFLGEQMFKQLNKSK
jgi:AAA15 family ATPase/GTPase